jgi:membrane protein DedA with SNARE-associated domain
MVACLLADLIWFYVGRRGGGGLLRFLGRPSLGDASSCGRTERLFASYGMAAVAGAKFLPGFGFLMPPLAGALGIGLGKFLRFDALGSLLYAIFYLELGVLFSHEVNRMLELSSRFGVAAAVLALALLMIFVAYKCVRRPKTSKPTSEPASRALAIIAGV